jgi:membrane protein DedA with SNARE-associated domain
MLGIDTFVEHFPYLGIFILLALGDMGFPFPEDTTLLLSGFLVAQGVTELLPTLLVVYPTLLLTDFSLYWVGKKYGRKIVEHRRFQKILSPEKLSKIEEKYERWGIFVIFFGRHLLGVRAQVFLTAGVLRMPAIKFLLSDGASAIITVTIMVGIGYLGGSRIPMLKEDVARFQVIAMVVFVIILAGWIFFGYFKSRAEFKKKGG